MINQTPFTPIPLLDNDKNIIIRMGSVTLKMDIEAAEAFIERIRGCIESARHE